MPHSTLKLRPGVDLNLTPTLNESALSFSEQIRYIPDATYGALPQKLGGWTKFFPQTLPGIARAIHAWEDTNGITHLAYGTQTNNGQANLGIITSGSRVDVTPRTQINSANTPAVSTTAGSSTVTITDTVVTGVTQYDTVYIPVPICVGGLVLFGQYQCGYLSNTTYTIQSVDTLGNPLVAPSSSTSPVVPQISVTSGSSSATVTMPAHGYSVGSTFTLNVSVTLGGTTLYGTFYVQTVIDANNFTIVCPTTPTSTTSAYVNGGNAYYLYGFGVGSLPSGTGFGVGGFGTGGFGTGSTVTASIGNPIIASDWTLDSYGQVLISCPILPAAGNIYGLNISTEAGQYITTEGGQQLVLYSYSSVGYQPLYAWDPTSGSPYATVIANAPVVNDGAFIAMPQRQIVAWGSSFTGIQDPLLIRWSDVGNYNSWIGTVTNQAGSYRIPRGSRIVGCFQAPQQSLVWTDLGLWSMQYIGQPYVYSFNELGSGCGLIARKAMGTLGGSVYWMSQSQFFTYGANGVVPVACPVWDFVFQDLDTSNLQKIRCAPNSRFGEIAWYFPTLSSGGEIGAYVKYNPFVGAWDFGTIARTAWIDQSVLGPPIGADPSSLYLYQHETSTDADGQPMAPTMQTGWFSLSDGDEITYVDQVWPDARWGYYGGNQNATINMTFYVADYPGQTPKVYGPYAVSQSTTYISPRFRGRLVSFKLSGNDTGTFWRLGGTRWRWSADGKF